MSPLRVLIDVSYPLISAVVAPLRVWVLGAVAAAAYGSGSPEGA